MKKATGQRQGSDAKKQPPFIAHCLNSHPKPQLLNPVKKHRDAPPQPSALPVQLLANVHKCSSGYISWKNFPFSLFHSAESTQ